ncbi:DUF922 domain-containing Zn-dependent protease [Synechococcus sp. PCC 6312]|uniref:DUF922 domain-containing Zn-dependent protease n=1 Tax=Synechococcus sp. (strain ATCC 27167 / PCC 6312) TaxID=195253 RepID=UPI00155A837B|nr:DUF922 domain-containing Zn-dependent protease [Synechococcus sp. PCC 6312]
MALLFSWLGLGQAWVASPMIHSQVNYYGITGTSALALRQQMNRLGPSGQNGRRFDAYTKWHVAWRYRYGLVGGSCRMTSLAVKTDITYTMPQWQNFQQARRSLQQQWHRYYQALQMHEDGHSNHGRAATQEIWQRLSNLTQPTCASMGQVANQAAQGIIRRYAQKDIDYDRQTGHGRTQGAIFP